MRRLVLLALLLSAAGCARRNLALDQALAAAGAARARGDVVAEAHAMRQACAAAPGDAEVCRRAAAVQAVAVDGTLRAAETACALVEASAPALDGCLAALEPVRGLAPDHPGVAELAGRAGDAHAARCGAAATTPADAIRRVRCAESRQAAIATPGYAAWVRSTRVDAAAVLIALADGFGDRLGARASALGVAQCLSPSADLEQRRQQAAIGFADLVRPALVVRGDAALGDLCATAAGPLGARVACAAAPRGDAIVLDAAVALGAVEHTTSESIRTERYLAGIDRHDNPEYLVRVDDERHARAQHEDAEEQARRSQRRCDEAEAEYSRVYCTDCPELSARDRRCERARDRQDRADERRLDWDRARDALAATPAVLEQEDWRDAHFTVRSHRWSLAWRAEVLGPDGATAVVAGATATSDEEHDGSDPAGLGPDPMTAPNPGWYLTGVHHQLAAHLTERIGAELSRRVQTIRADCASDDPTWTAAWLECRATAAALAGEPLASCP